MMHFVLTYRQAVDQITADKALKLRRYELDNDDWVIVEDLVSVLLFDDGPFVSVSNRHG